jgi:hypothetical protein
MSKDNGTTVSKAKNILDLLTNKEKKQKTIGQLYKEMFDSLGDDRLDPRSEPDDSDFITRIPNAGQAG